MRDSLQQFADTFAAYEPLMRKFLQNEIYSDLLVPDGSLDSMIVALQWIAMEYAVIRHAIFLSCDHSAIRYETVRDYLVVITRMTGYDEEDIYEYLENSFVSLCVTRRGSSPAVSAVCSAAISACRASANSISG